MRPLDALIEQETAAVAQGKMRPLTAAENVQLNTTPTQQQLAQSRGTPMQAAGALMGLQPAEALAGLKNVLPGRDEVDRLTDIALHSDIREQAKMDLMSLGPILGPLAAMGAEGLGDQFLNPAMWPTIPLAPARMAARTGLAAGQGAIVGLTEEQPTAMGVAASTLGGAAGDLGLQGVTAAARSAGSVIGTMAGATHLGPIPLPVVGNYAAEAGSAAAKQAVQDFKRIGVTPTFTQSVLGVDSDAPAAKGVRALQRLDASARGDAELTMGIRQGEELQKSFRPLIDHIAPGGDYRGVGARVGNSVLNHLASIKTARKNMWERGLGHAARIAGHTDMTVPANLRNMLDSILGAVDDKGNRIAHPNLATPPGVVAAARRLDEILGRKDNGALDIGGINEALEVIADLGHPVPADPRMLVGKRSELVANGKALRRALFDDLDQNLMKGAPKGAVDLLKNTRKRYAQMSREVESMVRAVTGKVIRKGGELIPDNEMASRLANMGPSDAEWLGTFLRQHAPDELENVQAAMIRRAVREGTRAGRDKKGAGAGMFDLNTFITEMGKMHDNAIFGGFERTEIMHAMRALQRMRTTYDRPLGTGGATGELASEAQSAAGMVSGNSVSGIFMLRNMLLTGGPERLANLLIDPEGRRYLRIASSRKFGEMAAFIDTTTANVANAWASKRKKQGATDAQIAGEAAMMAAMGVKAAGIAAFNSVPFVDDIGDTPVTQ